MSTAPHVHNALTRIWPSVTQSWLVKWSNGGRGWDVIYASACVRVPSSPLPLGSGTAVRGLLPVQRPERGCCCVVINIITIPAESGDVSQRALPTASMPLLTFSPGANECVRRRRRRHSCFGADCLLVFRLYVQLKKAFVPSHMCRVLCEGEV